MRVYEHKMLSVIKTYNLKHFTIAYSYFFLRKKKKKKPNVVIPKAGKVTELL